jgi:outer membrane protein assembly factor BamB
VYGVTYPVIRFFDYDFKKRETRFSFFTGSHFHESGLDDDGFFWGSWSTRRGHCLFRYHPDVGEPEFFDEPIPNLDPDHLFTFPMNGPIDSFINGGDGRLYFGTTLGELYGLEPKTGEHTLLGKPTDGIRLSGLVTGPEGSLLGSYGAYNETGLFLYDRKTGEFTILGAMRDDNASCFMIHDIAWDGGSCVFAAETDNVDRSSYLWEAHLED